MTLESHASDRLVLEFSVGRAGLNVISAHTESEALDGLSRSEVHIIVVVLEPPYYGSFDVIRKMRLMSGAPIMAMAERMERASIIQAFAAGADQVFCKPFFLDEFVARMHALLRRAPNLPQSDIANSEADGSPRVKELEKETINLSLRNRPLNVRQFGRLRVDPFEKCIAFGSKVLKFTDSEFTVMEVLAARQGTIVSRAELTTALHGGPDLEKAKVLEVILSRLRRKLAEALDSNHEYFVNFRGQGWSLNLGALPSTKHDPGAEE